MKVSFLLFWNHSLTVRLILSLVASSFILHKQVIHAIRFRLCSVDTCLGGCRHNQYMAYMHLFTAPFNYLQKVKPEIGFKYGRYLAGFQFKCPCRKLLNKGIAVIKTKVAALRRR